MTEEEFIDELKEILEVEELTAEQNLAELDEFDSLAIMSIVALSFSNFKIKLSGKDVKNAANANALIDLIGKDHFAC